MFPLMLVLGTAPGSDPGSTTFPAVPLPVSESRPAAPTFNRMFVACGSCAGPALSPFEMQPRVCPVAVCPCGPGSGTLNSTAWVKEFHSAAHFTYPRFDLEGHPVEGDGLLIYEGMRLAVDPVTGKYDLTFTATVPAMPVTVRLQLTFWNGDTSEKGRREYKLTLPPIRLEPPRDTKAGDPAPRTFQVAHRGFSSLFIQNPAGPEKKDCVDNNRIQVEHPCGREDPITCRWTVTRAGSARFGTPIAVDDPNR